MVIYTQLALEAFRKSVQAQRRYQKAEDDLRNAVGHVPSGDMVVYFLNTEIIRNEIDKREAEDNKDWTAVNWCERRILELRVQLKDLGRD